MERRRQAACRPALALLLANAVALSIPLAVGAEEAAPDRAFAVIVGIDDYSQAEGDWPNLPSCVNDAVELATLLAGQDLYRGEAGEERIHLFTQPVPGAPNEAQEGVPHVERHEGFKNGALSVLNALDEIRGQATGDDLILVSIAGHASYLEDAQEFRLLLPDYNPQRRGTYLDFEKVALKLAGVRAPVIYVLNTVGLPADYYSDLVPAPGRYRAVITACGPDQHSYTTAGETHSIFGKALIEALGDQAAFAALAANKPEAAYEHVKEHVTESARESGIAQEPALYAFREPPVSARIARLLEVAQTYLGTPYVFGGVSRRGLDTSGFVQAVFRAVGVRLPRTALEQHKVGRLVPRDQMQAGDRLYFDFVRDARSGRRAPGVVDHTGIYMGGGQFIHATPPRCRINKLQGSYLKNLIGIRRDAR